MSQGPHTWLVYTQNCRFQFTGLIVWKIYVFKHQNLIHRGETFKLWEAWKHQTTQRNSRFPSSLLHSFGAYAFFFFSPAQFKLLLAISNLSLFLFLSLCLAYILGKTWVCCTYIVPCILTDFYGSVFWRGAKKCLRASGYGSLSINRYDSSLLYDICTWG